MTSLENDRKALLALSHYAETIPAVIGEKAQDDAVFSARKGPEHHEMFSALSGVKDPGSSFLMVLLEKERLSGINDADKFVGMTSLSSYASRPDAVS